MSRRIQATATIPGRPRPIVIPRNAAEAGKVLTGLVEHEIGVRTREIKLGIYKVDDYDSRRMRLKLIAEEPVKKFYEELTIEHDPSNETNLALSDYNNSGKRYVKLPSGVWLLRFD